MDLDLKTYYKTLEGLDIASYSPWPRRYRVLIFISRLMILWRSIGAFKWLLFSIIRTVQQMLETRVTIPESHETYPILLEYLRVRGAYAINKDLTPAERRKVSSSSDLVQRQGVMCHKFKGKLILVTFLSGNIKIHNHTGPIAVVLRSFGRSDTIIVQFLREVHFDWNLRHNQQITLFRPCTYEPSNWLFGKRLPGRRLGTVVLRDGLVDDIRDDLQRYWDPANAQTCKQQDQPLRRGYLFCGPPGTGKTSLATAIAGDRDLSVYILHLRDPKLTDNSLLRLTEQIPAQSVLLIEDIDCAEIKRNSGSNSRSGVTLAGLLNAIDGLTAPQGHLLIMTTNNAESLDAALVRPGRIDKRFELQFCDRSQIRRLFQKRFAPSEDTNENLDRLATRFAEKIPENTISPAAVQNFITAYEHAEDCATAAITIKDGCLVKSL